MGRRFVRAKSTPEPESEPPKPWPKFLPGSKEKNFPGCVLVPVNKAPVHQSFPKVGKDIAPNTFYRVDIKNKRVRCMVTVDALGHHFAWDTCGACIQHISMCRCGSLGILHPDSIEWCLRKEAGWKDGHAIDFPVDMEAYKKQRRTAHRFAVDKDTAPPPKASRPGAARKAPYGAEKASQRRFIRTKSGAAKVGHGVTMADIDKAVSDVAAEAEAMFDTAPSPRTRVYKRRKRK